jgi:hypothetical protein
VFWLLQLGCVGNNCISVYYWPLNDKKCGRLLRVLLINLYLNDGILTCLSFMSIWNIALWWVYNTYIILSYSVLHFAILYYTKFVCMFVFQCHFMLCVILCVQYDTIAVQSYIIIMACFISWAIGLHTYIHIHFLDPKSVTGKLDMKHIILN